MAPNHYKAAKNIDKANDSSAALTNVQPGL